MIFNILSLFSLVGFFASFCTSVYFILDANYAFSAGFGLMACWWFILTVIFGYCSLRLK